jgi:chromate reductase
VSEPLKIAAIAASLRENSYSQIVMNAVERLMPVGTKFELVNIGELPLYNADLEQDAMPFPVCRARTRVVAADAVVIATPEFNHGMPGVLKNALDWLSRPAFSSCMYNKPVFFVTFSPGALGGVRAQYQLRETLASMLCRLVSLREIAITHIGTRVEDGVLVDPETVAFVQESLKHFLLAVRQDAATEVEEAR